MITDKALAVALVKAESEYDGSESEPVTLALNAICERLDLPLDQTEQGLTPKASAAVDEFVAEHFTS